jgi:hypothetical protein
MGLAMSAVDDLQEEGAHLWPKGLVELKGDANGFVVRVVYGKLCSRET